MTSPPSPTNRASSATPGATHVSPSHVSPSHVSPNQASPRCTVVIANGSQPLPPLPGSARVIVADGGLSRARRAGVPADVLVGDLDSVAADDLTAFTDAGGQVHAFATDKNQTDLELAIDLVDEGSDLIVVGGDGSDRFDHLLGEITHVAHRAAAFRSVTLHYPPSVITVLTGGRTVTISGTPGSIVSLVPLSATAYGVEAVGFRWPLDGEDLRAGTTRGISNELLEPQASVVLDQGILLIIQPVVIP